MHIIKLFTASLLLAILLVIITTKILRLLRANVSLRDALTLLVLYVLAIGSLILLDYWLWDI